MENILSFVWRYNLLKGGKFTLSNGEKAEIISSGRDCNGDLIFSDALLRIEDSTQKLRVAVAPASHKGCDIFVTDREVSSIENAPLLVIDFLDDIEILRKK
ncbi:MAG: hypothetical protein IJA09_07960, partial [Bacteroidales bacterium]|nr:hypothetical protein [Bacteroidales bacterium]